MIPTSQFLREATKDAHVNTEKAANLKSLFQLPFNRVEYADLLAANYLVWSTLALALQGKATAANLPGTNLLKAVDHLAVDLEKLGMSPLKAAVGPPELSGNPEVFGSAYVLYGSTLGSRYIYRAFKKQLGEEGESILGFYRFCATQPAEFWPEFQAVLNQVISTEGDQQRAAAAANAVFKAFEKAYQL